MVVPLPFRFASRRCYQIMCPKEWPTHTRTISFFGWGKLKHTGQATATTPSTSENRSVTDLLKRSPRASELATPTRGSLSESSIFGSERDVDSPTSSSVADVAANRAVRDPERTKWRWLKMTTTREVRRRGRFTKQETIARTEKQHIAASHFIKTSVKKLAPLTRQIEGKPLDHAIIQMRFSPKKAAREVLAHLQHAKNEAVVRKGMKLPEMYVAQAWVGRGPFERGLSHRAKGRIDMLRLPYTSITVLLKENATLDRIAREKEEKRQRKSVRQHLPSRPIYGQRQYYQW